MGVGGSKVSKVINQQSFPQEEALSEPSEGKQDVQGGVSLGEEGAL